MSRADGAHGADRTDGASHDRRTILLVGATSGIGRSCALQLAAAGHRLILVGRDRRRGASLLEQIGGPRRPVFIARDVSTRAGLMMPLLARGAGRVVNTNSEGHRAPLFGGGDVRLDFDDLQSARGYSPYLAYSRSKLANLLFTTEFHRQRPGFQTAAVHPGMVRTRLVRSMHSPGFWLLSTATRWTLASPSRGGRPLTELATAPTIHNGGYYNGTRSATPSPHAASRADAERLWRVTEDLRGPFTAA